MLFSNDEIAAQINDQFEAAWVSVRPVPTVTIDFGNGEVVKRTLHGNVATYVCNSDGKVLDVLPGIYEPKTYAQRLKDFVKLHEYASQGNRRPNTAWLLREYHDLRLRAIEEKAELKYEPYERSTIIGIEKGIMIALNPVERIQTRGGIARGELTSLPVLDTPKTTKELSEWESLARDTELNEIRRRSLIHKYLSKQIEATTPDQMKKWLYREVLHADLDDPYLGLGKILFDNYPFATEDE